MRALHTPGHRPEHTAFALFDLRRGEEPWAVLTGDTLFVGDVARPDLAIEKSDGARGIFRSLNGKLLGLGGDVEVWPATSAARCAAARDGHEDLVDDRLRAAPQPGLCISDEDEFVDRALAELGPQPPNFRAIVALNRGPLLTDGVEPSPLAPRQVEQRRADGAMLVDVRTDQQFDDAHIPGAVAIPMLKPASAPSSPGWPIASRRSSSSAATTRTAAVPAGWRWRSASAAWPGSCTAA